MTAIALAVVVTGAGVLLGAIVFLSAVLAPVVFQTLDAPAASRLLRAVFPRYYRLGLVCAGAALVAALGLALRAPGTAPGLLVALLAGATAAMAYSLWLVPRINAARDAEDSTRFRALHRRSVALSATTLGVALATLLLASLRGPEGS